MNIEEALHGWETFYVIIGSSAAALTGLQFVVIALISEARDLGGGQEEIQAFGTPTVVHFCAVLLVAAFCSVPHQSFTSLGICIVLSAIGALIYVFGVIAQARRTTRYVPVLEDWIFHAVIPTAAYGAMLIAGLAIHTKWSLYVIAAAALLLLYDGIHNAWDTALWISVAKRQRDASALPGPAPDADK